MRAWRQVDVPSVAGFAASSAGFIALMVEMAVRGWWGFATSGVEFLIVLGWLALSGWLSWWAYTWAEGGWKALAALGVGLSGVALVVVVTLFAFRVFVEFPDLIIGDANRKQKGRRSRRRQGPW